MKKVKYVNQEDLECLRYLSKCYDFALSLYISLAFNELETSAYYIRDRKEQFKHSGALSSLRSAIMEADRKRFQIRETMRNKGFFETYFDRVIDIAYNDLSLFKISIKQILDNHNVDESEFYAQIEITSVLLEACVSDFEDIAKDAIKRFGKDRSADFSEFNIKGVFFWFKRSKIALYRLVDKKYGDINLNTKDTVALFEKLHENIANGVYIEECMKAAQNEHPEFMSNDINIK